MRHRSESASDSVFRVVAQGAPVRTARKRTLLALSRHIEARAQHAVDPTMVFVALQRREFFSGVTQGRYRALAASCPLVAVFGHGLRRDLRSGIRGVDLDPDDPLCAEWVVVALGPHTATALVAREHDDNQRLARADADRRFEFVLTYDRDLVTTTVHTLMSRMA